MNEKKYPLFSPKLMQVNSFAYVSRDYTPSLQEERTAGVVGCAIEEAVKNELKDYTNVFMAQFDEELRKSEWSINAD